MTALDVAMYNSYKFLGTAHPYRKAAKALGWGDFFVRNERRSGRRLPLHPGDCPFCGMSTSASVEGSRRVTFGDETYLVIENSNPIVDGQRLIIPAGIDAGSHAVHRLDLNGCDVKLALHLTRNGFSDLLADTDARPWACYVNALPGTGRSVAHLHINCVPAHHVPLLPNAAVPWQICSNPRTSSTISRIAGIGFYALAIESTDDEQLGEAVADLHQHMNEWQQPYNVLIYPGEISRPAGLVIVPRASEYCEAADQRIAGLEFMTGVLIPGETRWNAMDTILRDRALWQATLKRDRQLQLERRLRSVYGLPPAGHVVRAQPIDRLYEPVVESNDSFTRPVVRRPAVSGDAVFGEIEQRDWFLPRPEPDEPNSGVRRLKANVLVRMTRASICQSDRRVLGKKKQADVDGLALGHEGGGYVVDPGPWAGELSAGEKVVVLPHVSCGDCEPCHRYTPNLCLRMKHLGFHLNGNLADLMAFPYQCVLPVGADFPDDALPLVEPLACVLRALFRIRGAVRELENESEQPGKVKRCFTIFGAGPMGCLTALAVHRNWSNTRIQIVEPNPVRRETATNCLGQFEIIEKAPRDRASAISFVASSNFKAADDAIATTDFGGTVLLFAGINTAEQEGASTEFEAIYLERVHRREQSVLHLYNFVEKRRLVGSSGYILDDVKRSLIELRHFYSEYYRLVQNFDIQGLASDIVWRSGSQQPDRVDRPAVELLLSPRGVNDPFVASSLKVLIRLSEPK